jgi:hypothetical protein
VAQNRAKRVKRRITCELVIDGKRYSGIVLDLSTSGIFVQTAISCPVGKEVEVHLAATRATPDLALRARVARGKRVPPQLLAAAGGGLGLRILDPPPGFAQLVGADEEPVASGAGTAPSSASPKPEAARRRFQVRLQAIGSSRSRLVTVQGLDANAARAEARSLAGSGWEVVDVSEQPR